MDSLGQYAAPRHVVAHLSDPHLRAGSLQYGVVDTVALLEQALARLARIDPPPQALVFTGDLADLAEPAAYQRLRSLVEPAAAAIGAQVIWVMGNHDERLAYSATLFGEASSASQDRVYDVAGLRIIALDTTVPGWHHGEITEDQLGWLADQLAAPAEHGTLLAMHHPPIPVPMLPLAQLIELADQARLAAVVTGTDVRGIIGGHFHYSSWSTFAGVPVSVASATCYTSDLAPDRRLLSGVDADQAFTMLHLYDDQVVGSIVPVADSPEIDGYGLEMAEPFAALSRQEKFELVARKDSPLYAAN